MRQLDRAALTIDDEPVVELDFGSLHIGMLFNQLGLECPEDPYLDVDVPGFETDAARRKVVKLAVNICISVRQRTPSGSLPACGTSQFNCPRSRP